MTSDELLERVTAATEARHEAERLYVLALVGAVDQLQRMGRRDAYARVAHAAGVSRQTVRELVMKHAGE